MLGFNKLLLSAMSVSMRYVNMHVCVYMCVCLLLRALKTDGVISCDIDLACFVK